MSDRERWIVYPLLLMSLGISVRDKILPSQLVVAMTVHCSNLKVDNKIESKSLTADYVRCNLLEANRAVAKELGIPSRKGGQVNVLKLADEHEEFNMSQWVEEGQPAPDFTLPADDGADVKLSELRGSPVVLYFYPRDDTPGCTTEACAFRDRSADLAQAKAKVFGISPDTLDSHRKFRGKFGLNFPLLADVDHRVAEQYGAWREKDLYGKKSHGIQRSTFLIDRDGQIAKVWRSVKVDGHDQQVLDALAKL